MTNHAELSRQLALALGYFPESVRVVTRWVSDKHDICEVYRTHRYAAPNGPDSWHPFDYRDPSVCLPLLAWLMREHDGWAFPMMWNTGTRLRITVGWNKRTSIDADTLEEATARAVIAVEVK